MMPRHTTLFFVAFVLTSFAGLSGLANVANAAIVYTDCPYNSPCRTSTDTGASPPSDEFIDLVTNIVYRNGGTGLSAYGADLPANGYVVIKAYNSLGACMSSSPVGCIPCDGDVRTRCANACALHLPPTGSVCIEYNVQVVGCHSVDVHVTWVGTPGYYDPHTFSRPAPCSDPLPVSVPLLNAHVTQAGDSFNDRPKEVFCSGGQAAKVWLTLDESSVSTMYSTGQLELC